MTKSILVLIAVLSTACAGAPHDHIQAVGFTDREVEIIQAAADEWCSVTAGAWCTEISTAPSAHTIELVTELRSAGLATLNGITGNCKIEVKALDTREGADWEQYLYLVSMHELGHLWDPRQPHQDGSIMNAMFDLDSPEWRDVRPPTK